jgi:PAS domain S-box-containing protein
VFLEVGEPERHDRFQAVLDAIPAPIWFKDAGGIYRGCNVAFERYLGVTRERIIGASVHDVAPRDLAEVYRAADLAIFTQGGTQVYENQVEWADGSRHEVIFRKAAIRDGAGRIGGLAGTMLDVSELRSAERELRARLAQQAALTRLAAGALGEEDPLRLIESAVQLTAAAHGADAGGIGELSDEGGRRMLRLAAGVGPRPNPGPVPLDEEPISSRVVASGEPLVVDDLEVGGIELPAFMRAARFRSLAAVLIGPRDAPLGVLALFSRATRRFSADDAQSLEATAAVLAIALGRGSALRAARNTEESFRQLVESTPDLVLFHRGGRVLYANPALLALLGRRRDEVLGSDVAAWVHPDDRRSLDPLPAADPSPSAEVRIRASDGHWAATEVFAFGVEFAGERARVAIGRDLTERRIAQARLARAERLASIGTLAAGVAHELNNPLTFVLSNIGFVADQLRHFPRRTGDSEGCEEALRALDEALEGAERMRVIVRDLRTLARADDASEGAVDVRRVVEYAANLAASEVRRRARLTWDLGVVPPVRGNEARLGQVMLNLIVNAAHAIPEGAPDRNEIRITVRQEEDGPVAISVSDTGAGIPPELRTRIFDPFFTTKPAGLGTGLGLWVCHNIVVSHGGTIDVDSVPGSGTTFRVLLPAAEPGVPAAPEEARTPVPQQRRVLVVDDEPLVVATVRRQLGSGFAVDAASGPTEALARIAGAPPYDAVVSDLAMPEGGGLALLETLRRTAPRLAGRMLFVSGGIGRDDAALLAATGCPMLEKPFDGAQLRAALRTLLG